MKSLDLICFFYYFLRNLAWIAFLLISVFFIIFKIYKVEANLWPVPVFVPTEIHIPTSEDLEREIDEDREKYPGEDIH